MSSINDLTPGTWNIDPAHSTVGFTVRHLMITKVHGTFPKFTGSVTITEDRLASSVHAEIDMASLTTGDAGRDGHVLGGDFFDVAAYPTMTFSSTSIVADGDEYKMTGDLTIKGVTNQVTMDLEFDGVSGDPWGGTRAGFSAETEINRKDWGIEYNAALETGGVVISEKVKIKLDIETVKA